MKTLMLPADLTSPAQARRLVSEVLTSVGSGVRSTVLLLTSELVTNVINHTDSAVRLTIDAGPPVRVEVHDGHAATDAFRDIVRAPRTLDLDALGGRGIALVQYLATRFGLSDDPEGGKIVWFEMDL